MNGNLSRIIAGLILSARLIAPEQSDAQINLPEPIRVPPEKHEVYEPHQLPDSKAILAIKRYAMWLFRPQFNDCFQNLEIKVEDNYADKISYSPRRITADRSYVSNFSFYSDKWAHEFFHHLDLACKAVDVEQFKRMFSNIPPNTDFKKTIEEKIADFHLPRYRRDRSKPVLEQDLLGERISLSFEFLYSGKEVPTSIAQFFETYVDPKRLPGRDFYKINSRNFLPLGN